MTRTSSFRRGAGALGALVALAVPMLVTGTAHALTLPAVDPALTSITLPLFGAPLTVDVTTDATGSLTNVAVNPADGLTAIGLKPNRVVFENAAGTGTVTVTNRNGRQSVTVRAGSLADVSGPGRWSGDLFGTGSTTTVDFTVGDKGDGSPDITGVATSDATAVIGATRYSTEDDEQEAKVLITFVSGAESRTVAIRVEVSNEDGVQRASLRVTLGRTRGVAQPAAEVAGPHAWDGQLCNGTAAHIDYVVGLDGTISGVSATPVPDSVRGGEHSTQVRFATGERVHLRAELEGGLITLDVSESFRCATVPGTNAVVALEPGDDSDGGREDDDDHSTGPRGDSGSEGEHEDEQEGEHEDEQEHEDEEGSGSGRDSGPRGESGRSRGNDD